MNIVALGEALRNDTVLMSILHGNNEIGVIQPIEEIAALLVDHPAYFDTFLTICEAKYPNATACMEKDRTELLAFYDFRASTGRIFERQTQLNQPSPPFD